VHAYSIDPRSGALAPLSISPLADSFPYISLDRTGRFLFGASYAGNVISVNAVGADGRVDGAPLQIIPLGHAKQPAEQTPYSLFRELPERRLEVRFGKFSMADFFDVNSYGNGIKAKVHR